MPDERLELVGSGIIALGLIGLGAYYLASEFRARRDKDAYRSFPAVDRAHFSRQYVRRAIGSFILIASGIAIFVGQGVMDWRASPRLYVWLWIGVLIGLFCVVALASVDLVAIYRYSRRHHKKIEQDKIAMLERQLSTYRAIRSDLQSPPSGWSPEDN